MLAIRIPLGAQKGIKERLNSECLGEPVSNFHAVPSKKDFGYLLLVLAAIAGLLVAIFSFLATAQFGEMLGLVLFLAVGGLLLAGYGVGLMFLGLAIVPITERVRMQRDRRLVTKSA